MIMASPALQPLQVLRTCYSKPSNALYPIIWTTIQYRSTPKLAHCAVATDGPHSTLGNLLGPGRQVHWSPSTRPTIDYEPAKRPWLTTAGFSRSSGQCLFSFRNMSSAWRPPQCVGSRLPPRSESTRRKYWSSMGSSRRWMNPNSHSSLA